MSGTGSNLDALLHTHSDHIKRLVDTFNTPNTTAVCTFEQASEIFRKHHAPLSEADISAALSYSASAVGKKEHDLSKAFSAELAKFFASNTPTPSPVPNEKTTKIRDLLAASGSADAVSSIPAPADSDARRKVEDFAVRFHADHLTDDELSEMLSFYNSPEGKRVVRAGQNAAVEIFKIFGI